MKIMTLRSFAERQGTDRVFGRDRHVGYRSFTEQYFDSCGIFNDAVIAIMATVARQERIRISERTKAGLEYARRKGIPLGRRRVRIDVERLKQLRADGWSFEQIAKELNCDV